MDKVSETDVAHEYGEALKEIGLLVFVFGMLYALYEANPSSTQLEIAAKMVAWAVGGAGSWHVGVYLERRRQ